MPKSNAEKSNAKEEKTRRNCTMPKIFYPRKANPVFLRHIRSGDIRSLARRKQGTHMSCPFLEIWNNHQSESCIKMSPQKEKLMKCSDCFVRFLIPALRKYPQKNSRSYWERKKTCHVFFFSLWKIDFLSGDKFAGFCESSFKKSRFYCWVQLSKIYDFNLALSKSNKNTKKITCNSAMFLSNFSHSSTAFVSATTRSRALQFGLFHCFEKKS